MSGGIYVILLSKKSIYYEVEAVSDFILLIFGIVTNDYRKIQKIMLEYTNKKF